MITVLVYFRCAEFQVIDCSGFFWLFRFDDLIGEMLTREEAVSVAQAKLER